MLYFRVKASAPLTYSGPDNNIFHVNPVRIALTALLLVFAAKAAAQGFTTTTITFDEPDLVVGPLDNYTKNGVTVRFLRRASVFRPVVSTSSSPNALINDSQDRVGDETGFQKPMIFGFSHLQRAVAVRVGLDAAELNAVDGSGNPTDVEASLIAYDTSGREIARDTVRLGRGPRAITAGMIVEAGGDLIHRAKLEYSGNNAEVLDDLTFRAATSTVVPRDTVSPVITINTPAEGAAVNARSLSVTGFVDEVNGVSFTLNGAVVPVRRFDTNRYEFNARVTLPDGGNRIEARATDEAGNTGVATRTVDVRIPARLAFSDVRFSQTGLLDLDSPMPTRRVAGKTGLFRVTLSVRTDDDRPTWLDSASVVVSGGRSLEFARGQGRTGGRFGTSILRDGENAYFFVPGGWLEAGVSHTFTLQLEAGGSVIFSSPLAVGWLFRSLPPITTLIVPQDRPYDDAHTRSLVRILEQFARIYPVADGIASLTGDGPGGIRFGVAPPVNYRGHTDPNDVFAPSSLSYEQGFLLHDHARAVDEGRDGMWGTPDDTFPVSTSGPIFLGTGEYLVFNFTTPEDADRNLRFDADELDRVNSNRGSRPTEASRRNNNFGAFLRAQAEMLRQGWNLAFPSARARRAVALVTHGPEGQNRTGWTGNAGAGERSYWASFNTDGADGNVNGALPHETGHTFFGPSHSDDGPRGTCALTGEAINLLTREVITAPQSIMCSAVGGPRGYFLSPREYDQLFDRFATGEELRFSLSAPLVTRAATQSAGSAADEQQTFVLVASIDSDGSGLTVHESYLTPAGLPPNEAGADGTYSIAFLDAGGGLLSQQPIQVSFEPGDGLPQPRKATFTTVSQFPVGTAFVEIRKDKSVLKRLTRSRFGPKLDKVLASTVKGPKGDDLTIEWRAGDPDGDALTYSIFYSIDAGTTFVPVVGGWRYSDYSVPASALAGGTEVQFKVVASDGFNTAEEISAPMSLPNMPPVAVVLSPGAGQIAGTGDITLRGTALDPEEGFLNNESLEWFRIDGKLEQLLGKGQEVTLKPMPPGQHTIRLVAKDREGRTSTDETTVYVQPPAPAK